MLTNIPEYVSAHVEARAPSAGSGDIAGHRHEGVAQYRRERGVRLNRYTASVRRALPFVRDAIETEMVGPVTASEST
jgi:hypothetical protein